MSNQPENEEHTAENTEILPAIPNLSSKSQNQSSNQTSLNLSNVKSDSEVKDGNTTVDLSILQTVDISNNRMEVTQIDKIANERRENKKTKTLRKLHAERDVGGLSTEREDVGDDLNKKNDVHILCECEPSVAGAAVPTVISFNSRSENTNITEGSTLNMARNDSIPDSETIATTGKSSGRERENLKDKVKLTHKIKEIDKKIMDSENAVDEKHDGNNPKVVNSPRESNQSLQKVTKNGSADMKMVSKKPSLIPKLSRVNNNSRKVRPLSKEDDKRDNTSYVKTEATPKTFSKSAPASNKIKESKTYQNSPRNVNAKVESQSKLNGVTGNAISLKMLSLQERLKATTTMLRQKIDMDKSSSKLSPRQSDTSNVSEEPDPIKYVSISNKKTIQDLYSNISELKQIASSLLETNTIKGQIKYIEKLYKNISDIKKTADKLQEHEGDEVQLNNVDNLDSDDSLSAEKEKGQKSSSSTKDNKIYIKVMQTKDRKQDGKRKKKEGLPEQSEEVQANLSLGARLTSESLNSDTCLTEIKDENKIKETDSMDGIFIPTCEPPRNMEEEEETTGLDITITFPFNRLQPNGTDSHISVCLSEISAEALGKLKRCPKEFTLRMDFVEGKVLFHSGKGPANNFSIGPDLKFTEHCIDNKQSDVINIKPSTECSFASQLIPVENAKGTNSLKTLKSTDSELFNVVNLPLLYKSPYLNPASHKSCISFNDDKIMSMSFIARQLFKSMPQIPSLTNIFEDQIVDSFNKTDTREEAKKSAKSEKKN